VLVMEVEHDSVAREEGIRVGHVITEVNRQPVTTPKQFREAALAAEAKKGAVVVFVTRDAVRCAVLKDSGKQD
jgi:S1-C subfamily serine protease